MNALTAGPAASALLPNQAEKAASIRSAMKSSLYPGASDESVDMVLDYCRAAGLDPLTKPVHIVPMRVKDSRGQYSWRDVVMPGIGRYRIDAHRTGEYGGQDEPEFGESRTMHGVTFPEWCRVTVYRLIHGQRVPFSARVFWLESYATAKNDTDAPNAMWRKRPFGQLEKCAEALALRKAFPEAVGNAPTAEEMEGRILDAEFEPAPQAIAGPRRKSEAAQQAGQPAPQAQPKPETDPAPAEDAESPQGDAQAEEQPARLGPEDPEAGEPTVELPVGKYKVLIATLGRAGKTEADLLADFGGVSESNLNDALAWARSE